MYMGLIHAAYLFTFALTIYQILDWVYMFMTIHGRIYYLFNTYIVQLLLMF